MSLAGWSLFGLAQTKVAGGWVFFNGSRCLNPRQQLYVGDLLTIGANVSFGLNVPVVPLPNPHGWGVSIQPLAAGRTESDTPGFVEVDELTQTLGVLLEPRDW